MRRDLSPEEVQDVMQRMRDRQDQRAIAEGAQFVPVRDPSPVVPVRGTSQILIPPVAAHNTERSQLEDLKRMVMRAHNRYAAAMRTAPNSNGRRKKLGESNDHLRQAVQLAVQLHIDPRELGEWAVARWAELE